MKPHAPEPAAQLRAFAQAIARDVTALRARLTATVRADESLDERAAVAARIHNATHAALEAVAQACTAAGIHPRAVDAAAPQEPAP